MRHTHTERAREKGNILGIVFVAPGASYRVSESDTLKIECLQAFIAHATHTRTHSYTYTESIFETRN